MGLPHRIAPLVAFATVACAAAAPPPQRTQTEVDVQVVAPPAEPESPVEPADPAPSSDPESTCPSDASTRNGAVRALVCRFRDCYQNSLKSDPELHGKMTLKLRLAPDGSVVEVRTDGDHGLEPLWPCMRSIAQRFRFPPLEELDDDELTIPLTFVPAP